MDGDDSITVVARWGEQLHVRWITEASSSSPRAAATYVAKYATKCSDDLGLGNIGEIESRAETSGHLVALVAAAQRPANTRCKLVATPSAAAPICRAARLPAWPKGREF
jgi:hypothetical protein